MFKKFISLSLLAMAFVFVTGTAKAQLTFYNGSSCPVTVKAAAVFGPATCTLPTCSSNTVTIAPFTTGTLSVAPCVIAVTPVPSYRAIKFATAFGVSGFVDLCTGPPTFSYVDCLGGVRTLSILSGSFAAIF